MKIVDAFTGWSFQIEPYFSCTGQIVHGDIFTTASAYECLMRTRIFAGSRIWVYRGRSLPNDRSAVEWGAEATSALIRLAGYLCRRAASSEQRKRGYTPSSACADALTYRQRLIEQVEVDSSTVNAMRRAADNFYTEAAGRWNQVKKDAHSRKYAIEREWLLAQAVQLVCRVDFRPVEIVQVLDIAVRRLQALTVEEVEVDLEQHLLSLKGISAAHEVVRLKRADNLRLR